MDAPRHGPHIAPPCALPTTPACRTRCCWALFAVATFLNAALLFAVEPMFTKMVLPLLGGTPSVWNTCLLFFQAALLAGYLYAHVTSRWLTPVPAGRVAPGAAGGVGVAAADHVPPGSAPPAGAPMPIPWLLGLLATRLGLPFLLLAAGAPMLQRWFAATRHATAHNPYVLYVASNIGSFAALMAYPTLLERRLRLSEQSVSWLETYWGLIALLGLCAAAALVVARCRPRRRVRPARRSRASRAGEATDDEGAPAPRGAAPRSCPRGPGGCGGSSCRSPRPRCCWA